MNRNRSTRDAFFSFFFVFFWPIRVMHAFRFGKPPNRSLPRVSSCGLAWAASSHFLFPFPPLYHNPQAEEAKSVNYARRSKIRTLEENCKEEKKEESNSLVLYEAPRPPTLQLLNGIPTELLKEENTTFFVLFPPCGKFTTVCQTIRQTVTGGGVQGEKIDLS